MVLKFKFGMEKKDMNKPPTKKTYNYKKLITTIKVLTDKQFTNVLLNITLVVIIVVSTILSIFLLSNIK